MGASCTSCCNKADDSAAHNPVCCGVSLVLPLCSVQCSWDNIPLHSYWLQLIDDQNITEAEQRERRVKAAAAAEARSKDFKQVSCRRNNMCARHLWGNNTWSVTVLTKQHTIGWRWGCTKGEAETIRGSWASESSKRGRKSWRTIER